MKIGFDLDKIFINTPLFIPDKIIDKFYKKQDDDGELIYRIPQYPEQIFRKITHLPFMRPGIKNNLEFIENISKKNNMLYLISSRYKFLEKETNQIIKRHQLDKIFNSMHFNFENKQPHHFKNDVLKKLKLDAYVDDDLSLLKHVSKNNPKTKFYWLNHSNNKQALPKNIKQIFNLEEIFKK